MYGVRSRKDLKEIGKMGSPIGDAVGDCEEESSLMCHEDRVAGRHPWRACLATIKYGPVTRLGIHHCLINKCMRKPFNCYHRCQWCSTIQHHAT